jgi:hypothetical protein
MTAQSAATTTVAKQLATDYVAKREAMRNAKRLQKARERERAVQRAEQYAQALADQIETMAEHLAPKVQREPIFTAEGQMIVGSRIAIVNGRAVRSDSIATVLNHCRASETQKRAAKQILNDWSDVGAGVGVGAVDYLRSGGGGDGTGGHDAILAQVDARQRLEGALTFLGAFTGIVGRVVFDGIPLSVYAAEMPTDDAPKTAVDARALLLMAMSRLAMFYWPPDDKPVGGELILAFGPARAAYTVELDAG